MSIKNENSKREDISVNVVMVSVVVCGERNGDYIKGYCDRR
jgi:hypothetical protein